MNNREIPYGYLRKLWLVMRLTTVILIATLMQVSALGIAQKVTFIQTNASLEQVFNQINKQTGYNVMWSSKKLNPERKINAAFKNADLEEVLDACLEGNTLIYNIEDKNIVIKEKAPSFLERLAERWASIDVSGRVLDEKGNPLPGASVKVKGKNQSTTAGAQGDFELKAVDEGAILVISYIGYKPQELKARKNLGDIKLEQTVGELEEVAINKGYYTTSKILNTGNVSSVKADEISRQPVGDPMAALISKVPGLFVQQTSGVNGRAFKIRLRGQNSLDNGNDPLFIVDGVQYNSTPLNANSPNMFTAGGTASPFNYLNPSEIESIEVLKDADATAIYGSRGANGVILITTKKAKDGKLELNARYYRGISEAPLRVKLMNTQEYLAMRRKAFEYDNQTPAAFDYDLNGTWDTTRNTDWQKYFIGGTAPSNDISLDISMGNGSTAFRIGTGYRTEGTVYPGDFSSKRGGVNFGINHSAIQNKLNLSFSGMYGYSWNNLPIGNAEQNITLAPNAPDPYNPDGTLNWANSTWENPMAFYEQTTDETAKTLLSNFTASYNIWRKLILKTSFGYTLTNFNQRGLRPWSSFNPAFAAFIQPSVGRRHTILSNEVRTLVIEPQLSYSQSLLNGDFDVIIGGTYQYTGNDRFTISANGYPSDFIIKSFSAGTSFSNANSVSSDYKYSSIYGKVGYAYKSRYVVNLTGRNDASSRFGPGRRTGNFGAVGLGWIFTNEGFLRPVEEVISFGKLRASYGTTGNDQLGEYQYLDTYSILNLPYQGNTSLIPTQLTNPLYGWERVNKLEFGLELGLMKNSVNINASWYRNRTKNQLVQIPLPSTVGFDRVRANLPATLQNSGFELEIRSRNIERERFSWNTAFSLTVPRNKVLAFPGLATSAYSRRVVIGEPINTLIFAYNYTGLDPNTGMYTFSDLNKDGSFTTTQDQIPNFYGQEYFGGLYNNFKIGRLEVDFQFQFTKQTGYGYLSGLAGFFNGGLGNLPREKTNVDQQPYSQGNVPILIQYSMFSSSNGYIVDASFIRLKNAGIYYNLPLKGVIKRSKVFIQGQNLFTLTNYFGSDPESPNTTLSVAPLRTVAAGIQITL